MKKTIIIVTIFMILIGIFLCINKTYAAEKAIDNETESKIIEIKENAMNSLEDYKQKYGSDAYGFVAYILNLVRIYSIPLCFLGIAIGAIHQYVIGIRKLDTRKGNGFNCKLCNNINYMPNFTVSICCVCKIWKGVTNESFICCK